MNSWCFSYNINILKRFLIFVIATTNTHRPNLKPPQNRLRPSPRRLSFHIEFCNFQPTLFTLTRLVELFSSQKQQMAFICQRFVRFIVYKYIRINDINHLQIVRTWVVSGFVYFVFYTACDLLCAPKTVKTFWVFVCVVVWV